MLSNNAAWQKIPKNVQGIITKEFEQAALAERADIAKLNDDLVAKLKAAGMTFVQPDIAAFRSALSASPFYADWKEKFGAKAWETLERYSGKLGK